MVAGQAVADDRAGGDPQRLRRIGGAGGHARPARAWHGPRGLNPDGVSGYGDEPPTRTVAGPVAVDVGRLALLRPLSSSPHATWRSAAMFVTSSRCGSA